VGMVYYVPRPIQGTYGNASVVDPDEDQEEKLRKVRSFLEFFKQKCKDLYQPFQHVAVDER